MSITSERNALAAQGLDIRPREEWGAVTDYSTSRPVEQAIALFLHIAVVDDPNDLVGGEHQVMRNTERVGRTRFGATIGISYNAAAFDTGRLYEGQPLERRGAHTVNDRPNPAFRTGGLNHLVRALVLPQQVTDDVTDAQVDAAARWGAAVIRAGFAVPGARWWGHRDVTAKSCPGEVAYRRLAELNDLTRHYEAHGLTRSPLRLPPEDPDMKQKIVKKPGDDRWWLTDGIHARHVATREEAAKLHQDGLSANPTAEVWPDAWVNRLVKSSNDAQPVPEIDTQALADELGPMLQATVPALTDADLQRVATAVADEEDRRSRERLG